MPPGMLTGLTLYLSHQTTVFKYFYNFSITFFHIAWQSWHSFLQGSERNNVKALSKRTFLFAIVETHHPRDVLLAQTLSTKHLLIH